MPSFGKFETTRELDSGHGAEAVAELYAVRLPGESPPRDYVIKVFCHSRLAGEDQQTQDDLDPLLSELSNAFGNQIELQKKTAKKSPRVAQVIDSGQDTRGPWFATPFYPRTLQKMILGRVAVDAAGFLHVIRCITEGALAFKQECGRSHGNLKLANVFISGAGKLSRAEVAVSDPLPGGEEESARYEKADLRAIGRIIHQLVRRREMSEDDLAILLPIRISKEWTETFGKTNAPIWLEICNRLLDSNLLLSSYNLERLAADLKQFEPKPLLPKPALIGLAALLVVGGGLAIFLHRPGKPAEATVKITSDPPGAEIFVDKKSYGQTGKSPLEVSFPTNSTPREIKALWWEQSITKSVLLDGGFRTNVAFNFSNAPVTIESSPPGAIVTFNVSTNIVTGRAPFKTNQPVGLPVVYQLALPKYQTGSITSIVEQTHAPISLTTTLMAFEGTGEVDFPATFTRGVIFNIFTPDGKPADAREVGDQPKAYVLPPGDYIVRSTYSNSVSHMAWPEFKKEFTITNGQRNSVSNEFPYGHLIIGNASLDPISISIDGKPHDSTLQDWRYWPTGRYTVSLAKGGFDPTNVTLVVEDGKTTNFVPQLIPRGAFVSITTDPSGAQLFAGGKLLGTTSETQPLDLNFTNLGTLAITAHLDDLDDVTRTIELKNHSHTNLNFSFVKSRIKIDLDPSDAELSWGPNFHTNGMSSYVFYGKPGSLRTYKIQSTKDYISVTTNLAFGPADDLTHVPIVLPHAVVPVTLKIDPPDGGWAVFDENGTPVKMSNSTVPWGKIKLTASNLLLGEFTTNLEVKPAQSEPISLSFPYGTIEVTSTPPNAAIQLEVNKKSYELGGVTPALVKVKPGQSYSFVLSFGGFTSNLSDVKVGAGQTNLIGILFPVPPDERALDPNGLNLQLKRVDDGLWVGKYHVTQWQYEQVMGAHTNANQNGDKKKLPVDSVSWVQANEFCGKLNKYPRNFETGLKFRLPTLPEWSFYAADAKGNRALAVYGTNHTAPVGSKGTNALGICDAVGNLWQWLSPTNGEVWDQGQPMWAGLGYNSGRFEFKEITEKEGPFGDTNSPVGGFRVVLSTPPASAPPQNSAQAR